MPPTLPNPISLLAGFFSNLYQYLQGSAVRETVAQLVQFLWTFVTVFERVVEAVSFVFRNVNLAWRDAKAVFDRVGGDVKGIAVDNHDMWHHLRYTLMPNTINYIWRWVWTNWIKPLREGLVKTIGWSGRWDWYLLGRIHDDKTYTYDVQVKGRNYREKYVYPQLLFVLSPWRVAYAYAQQITVAVAEYLNNPLHSETRDTVSRVVYSDMGRLWQSFDKHLAEWLLTDASQNGWGSEVPEFPDNAKQPLPPLPPGVWEPFVPQPADPPYPSGSPDIPRVDWSY